MKKSGRFAMFFCLMAVSFTGCGLASVPEVVDTDTIAVAANGEVTAYVVGEFDKDYYNISELTSMATEETDKFNQSRDGEKSPVVLEKVEAVEASAGRVVITYRFEDGKTYTDFNENSVLFFGTVEEAEEQGYLTKAVLKSMKDGTALSEEELKQNGGKRLIITDAGGTIYCPSKVTHLSEGAVLNEDGSVNASEAEGMVYILLKK